MPKTSDVVMEARKAINVKLLAATLGKKITEYGKKGIDYSEAKSVSKAKKDKKQCKQLPHFCSQCLQQVASTSPRYSSQSC